MTATAVQDTARARSPAWLCLDVGLSAVKAVLFDSTGAIVSRQAVRIATHRTGDVAEQDPETWWAAAGAATRRIVARHPARARRIDGIGVTGHMHALVTLDRRGRSRGPALVLGDRRAAAEAASLAAAVGPERVYQITGTRMDASMPAAKIRWLRREEPDRFREARVFTGCKDAVRGRLTGPSEPVTEPVDACATSLYDIRTGEWSADVLAAVGVGATRLPAVRPCQEIAGHLHPDAAAELGLRAGIPVVVGAGDDVEVLGNGLISHGHALEHLGTTGSILASLDQPVSDPAMAIELYPHPVAGMWVVGGSMTTAGAALEWAARLLGYRSVAVALAAVAGSVPGPVFLPHLEGARCPTWNPAARGAWLGLGTGFRRADLMRAVCEGVAAALAEILERVERLAGPQRRLTVSAGHEWSHLRAAAYGRDLTRLDTPEPTALGLLALLFAAVGVHADVPAAANDLAARCLGDTVAAPPARGRSGPDRSGDVLDPLWVAVGATVDGGRGR